MPTTNLDDLNFENEGKITAQSEPTGTEDLVASNFWNGDVSGEITTRDKKFPTLNLGQKAGNIGEDMGFGSLVLNKDTVILPGFPSNENHGMVLTGVVVPKIQKMYQEKREYDPANTTLPQRFATAKEAVAAGFSTEYGGGERFVQPVAAELLLVPVPNGMNSDLVEQIFPYEFAGNRYLAAGFFAAGTSWHEAAKPVFTAWDLPKVRERGLSSVRWNMSVIRRTGTKGTWYALKLSAAGFNSPELTNAIKEIFSPKQQ
jgi:hypothetical protein